VTESVPGPPPEESPTEAGSRLCLVVLSYLALTLLVAGIFTNHHDVAVATNHLALVTHWLDAGAYLHDLFLIVAGLVPERFPGPFLIQ
jgi:hypothetical protein